MTKKIVYVIVFMSLLISPVFAEEKPPSKITDQEQIDELAAESGADPTRQRDKLAIVCERNNYPHDTYYYVLPGRLFPVHGLQVLPYQGGSPEEGMQSRKVLGKILSDHFSIAVYAQQVFDWRCLC